MKYCHYLFVALGITSAAILASCQDEDFGYTADQIAYRTNFEKMYGSVKDIPTWDFSSYNLRQMGLAGGLGSSGMTRANSNGSIDPWSEGGYCVGPIADAQNGTRSTIATDVIKDGTPAYYEVKPATLTWLNRELTEGVPHLDKGTSFKLVKPSTSSGTVNDFLIIPIYQGHSGMTWDLHLVAENNSNQLMDYKIWTHSDNILYTRDYRSSHTNSKYSYVKGEEYFYDGGYYEDNNHDVPQYSDSYGNRGWATFGPRLLKLGSALRHMTDDGISSVKIHFVMPTGASLSGYFGNIFYDDNTDNKHFDNGWGLDIKPTDGFDNGDGTKTYTYDLVTSANDIRNDNNFKTCTDIWSFGLKISGISGCSISSYNDNRVRIFTEYDFYEDVLLTDTNCGSSTENYLNRHTIDRLNVKSQPIRINCSEIKDDFFLYLDVTRGDEYVLGNNVQATTHTRQRSDQGMMLALIDEGVVDADELTETVKTTLGITDGVSSCEYFVIGCEDANLNYYGDDPDIHGSDWDINDVVFLIVGLDKAPKIRDIVSKRYMIEDLGSTFDFDFNDIVLDVTQERTRVPNQTPHIRQTATLKHLCGTIPFKIKIGDVVLGNSYTGLTEAGKFPGCNIDNCGGTGSGYDPSDDDTYATLQEFEIFAGEEPSSYSSIWDPNTNNIYMTTWPRQAGWLPNSSSTNNYLGKYDEESSSFSFPASGMFPYIIACDPSVGWMDECVSVPSSWFTTWHFTPYTKPNGGGSNGGNNGGSSTPQRVTITLQDNNQLNISDLSSAKTTDKVEFAISFDLSKAPENFAITWGIGGFANDSNPEEWTVVGTEWTYGGPSPASNSNWTQEVSVGDIRSLATTLGHSTYIKLNVYNGCSIKSVTLVKQ